MSTADPASFDAILRPKLDGTLVLDALLQEQSVDFICHFSSSAALFGDFGVCSYSFANRFQTAHAGRPDSNAFAICWPYWRDGGMRFATEEAARLYLRSSGQRVLESQEGFEVFEALLSRFDDEGCRRTLVLAGERERLDRLVGLGSHDLVQRDAHPATLSPRDSSSRIDTAEWVLADLREIAGRILQLAPERIDPAASLADFGFDSIGLLEFARQLSAHYGVDISPSMFFNHPALNGLASHLVRTHGLSLERARGGHRCLLRMPPGGRCSPKPSARRVMPEPWIRANRRIPPLRSSA